MEELLFEDTYEGENEEGYDDSSSINISNTQTYNEMITDHYESADGVNVMTLREMEAQSKMDNLELFFVDVEITLNN